MQLYHAPFCPHSRFIRLALAEYGVQPVLVHEDVTARREGFLAINPANTLPLLVEENGFFVSGVYGLPEYLEETLGKMFPAQALMPLYLEERVEMRRLLAWFHGIFYRDISLPFTVEMIDKRFLAPDFGGGAPDMLVLRSARSQLKGHLAYIDWLCENRAWLSGATLSYADLAAGAHLSVLDYFGDVTWSLAPHAKEWYARLKSRPSFRTILADRVVGMPPVADYTNLDF